MSAIHPREYRANVDLLDGLPLLPCGAGDSFKAPLPKAWQLKAFSLQQVLSYPGLRCIGTRCGQAAGGLVVFDFDGQTAVDHAAKQFGIDVGAIDTWTISRPSDAARFKLVFRVPETLWDGLPDKKTTISTGQGQQIEIFWDSGQVIVAGEHVISGDQYEWGGTSPKQIAELPMAFSDLWQSAITERVRSRRGGADSGDWRDAIPCPICGRTDIDCRVSSDGSAVLCHYGKRWSPPMLAEKESIERGGSSWIYAGDRDNHHGTGRAALFRKAQPEIRQQHKATASDALRLMAEQLGEAPRLNIRTRGVLVKGVELKPHEVEKFYLRASAPPSPNRWAQPLAKDALLQLAYENSFDPVERYLNGITAQPLPDSEWTRLGQFLLGIDDQIADLFLPRFLVGMVARVFQPGCQFRQTPVLQGEQNIGKTEFGRALFGDEFYGDGLTNKLDVDDVTLVHFTWCTELAELNGLTRVTQKEHLKAFLSRRTDFVRRKYGAGQERLERRCGFIATTNGSPLTDGTGSTRFVMIPLPDQMLPRERVALARDAIWARALREYRRGFQWWSTEAEMDAILARNAGFELLDPWTDPIEGWLKRQGSRPYVQIDEIFNFLDVAPERRNNHNHGRVRDVTQRAGWIYRRRKIGGRDVRAYWNPVQPAPAD